MKTYNTLFLAVLILICNLSNSQDVVNNQTFVTTNNNSLYSFDLSDKTIQGSPYTQESFLPAKISADSGTIVNAKYNAVTDEIEVETTKSTAQSINKYLSGISITFIKDNKTYQAITYFNEEDAQVLGYLIPISNTDSKIKLYAKEKKVFVEGKPAKTSYQPAKPSKFSALDDTYYILIDNAIAKPMPNNKKQIASLFPKNEKAILDYIGTEKLNTKKQADLIKLVNYINTL